MTTPAGLLRWGQSGRYSAREDRQVITALAGKRAGIVTAVRLSPALGLGIAVDPGWLAIAECGDGTFAVLTSDDGAEVQAAQGGAEAREDEFWAIVTDPEAAQPTGSRCCPAAASTSAYSSASSGCRPGRSSAGKCN